jgi:hypothetical protein
MDFSRNPGQKRPVTGSLRRSTIHYPEIFTKSSRKVYTGLSQELNTNVLNSIVWQNGYAPGAGIITTSRTEMLIGGYSLILRLKNSPGRGFVPGARQKRVFSRKWHNLIPSLYSSFSSVSGPVEWIICSLIMKR